MNQQAVAKAAETAGKIVGAIKDHTLRPVAFGVVFERILDSLGGVPTKAARSQPVREIKPRARASAKKAGPQARLQELANDGYFKVQRTLSATMEELASRGYTGYDQATIGKGLQRLVVDKVLRRKKVVEGKKTVYAYVNW